MKREFSNEIIYQIFPERFNIGNGASLQKKINNGKYSKSVIAKQWHELPQESGESQFEMFGGDLQGVSEKMDYICELGATAIYLTPIFPSESNHKYDAYDYYSIDRAFGGDEIFKQLLEEVHRRGLKLIIDLVLNHLSDTHPFFQAALNDYNSPYRDYFCFTEYPHEYSCWWGYKSMPELNLANEAVINEFITGEKSVIRHWAAKGVDGMRLDCANDLGTDICDLVTKTAKQVNPEIIVIGEIFNFAPDFSHSLDSLQTYFFTGSILNFLNGNISSLQFGKILEQAIKLFPHEKLINNLLILSSHDSPRILSRLHDQLAVVRLAFLLQFTLPGVPKIYYGDEIGMLGDHDPHNRAPMIWDKSRWNHELRDYIRTLIALRKDRRELRIGKTIDLSQSLENGVVAFLRYDSEEPSNFSIIIINPENTAKKFNLFIPYTYLFAELKLYDKIHGHQTKAGMSDLEIEIGPMEANFYTPDPLYKKNYNFYKRTSPIA